MSRYEVLHDDKGLAFGIDHACGEFLMIWTRPADPKERRLQDSFGPNPEDMLVDKDTVFNKDFDNNQMLQLIAEHGFELSELEKSTGAERDRLELAADLAFEMMKDKGR